jgi:hypothetical protein
MQFDCPRCGSFEITRTALTVLKNRLADDAQAVARASHAIRAQSSADNPLQVDSTLVDSLISQPLPDIDRQLKNLVAWIGAEGDAAPFPRVDLSMVEGGLEAIVGAANVEGVQQLLSWAEEQGVVEFDRERNLLGLTRKGWQKDPPKDPGGRGAQVLPPVRSSGGDPTGGAGGRVDLVLQPLQMGSAVPPKGGSVPSGIHGKSLRAERFTVGTAKRVVARASVVLQGLSIPNDLSEDHRDLFVELQRSIANLQQSLAELSDENRRLSEENEVLRNKIAEGLPLWKRACEEFVLKAAAGAGTTAGKGAVFTAGFIAGMTYSAFAGEPPGIPV